MKKRLVTLILALVMVLSLAACSDGEPEATDTDAATTAAETTDTEAPETEPEDDGKDTPTTPGTEVTPGDGEEEKPSHPSLSLPTNPEITVTYTEADVPSDGVITTPVQLGAVLTHGALNGNYTLGADIDMTNATYTGLGTTTAAFTGTFDGAGHTIKGIRKPMFCVAGVGAEIKNFTVSYTNVLFNSTDGAGLVNGKNGGITGGSYVWAYVVAYATNTTDSAAPVKIEDITIAEDCVANVNIGVKEASVAGIVGIGEGFIKLDGCVNKGELTSTVDFKVWMGGISGYICGKSAAADANITNCANYGDITFVGTGKKDTKQGGCFAAVGHATVSKCANYGTVTNYDESSQVAGIAGYIGGLTRIEYCVNGGKITGDINNYISGIAAYSNKGSGRDFVGCINYGTVEYIKGEGSRMAVIVYSRSGEKFENCHWLASSFETYGDVLCDVGFQKAQEGGTPTGTATNCSSVATMEELFNKLNALEGAAGAFELKDNQIVLK